MRTAVLITSVWFVQSYRQAHGLPIEVSTLTVISVVIVTVLCALQDFRDIVGEK